VTAHPADVTIRDERPDDAPILATLITAAFAGHPHSAGTEAAILDALRRSGALALSLVAARDDEAVGHVAFSPVLLNGEAGDWMALGPLAVRPNSQQQGIGSALVEAGLARIAAMGAAGCFLIGEPDYYRRFGFIVADHVRYGDMPPGYLQYHAFAEPPPAGTITFDPAFSVAL